jgi:hypothetical protein
MFGFSIRSVEIKRVANLKPNIMFGFGAKRLKKQTLFLISLSHSGSAANGCQLSILRLSYRF